METIRNGAAALFAMMIIVSLSSSCGHGGKYWKQPSAKSVEITKAYATVITHTILAGIRHDLQGTSVPDIQKTFERIGKLRDFETLRIFDEDAKVLKSADPLEVGLKIEDIGYEIHRAGYLSMPFRSGKGHNSFCMLVEIQNEDSCRTCHKSESAILGILELCIPIRE